MYHLYFIIQWFSLLCLSSLGLWVVSWWFLLLLIPLIILRLDCVRVRIRTLRCGGCYNSPRTRDGMIKACSNKKVTVVGQGWHFFLQRKGAPGKIVFTQRFKDPYPLKDPYTYKNVTYYPCGMTIGALAKKMKKEGKAFWSMPSYENISVGAWIMDWNHGSQGIDGNPSDHAFDMVDYLDTNDNEKQDKYEDINRDDIKCLLGVSIDKTKLNDNKTYEKSAMIVNSEEDMKEWLKPCVQRVLFIGRQNIGVVWREKTREADTGCCPALHKDPHLCSRFCLWFQIDPLNFLDKCGCCNLFSCLQEDMKAYNSLVDNYTINRLVPYIATVMTVFACSTYNFEIFVDLGIVKGVAAFVKERTTFLHNLVQELSGIKSGRFEIRYGSRFLFIDVSLKSGFERPFEILQGLGVKEYALHKGKYQVEVKNLNLTKKDLAEFYGKPGIPEIRPENVRLRLRF